MHDVGKPVLLVDEDLQKCVLNLMAPFYLGGDHRDSRLHDALNLVQELVCVLGDFMHQA